MSCLLFQQDMSILNQSAKEIYSRIELLNKNKKILTQIEGVLISDSLTIDSESDVCRSYTCELQYSKENWNRINKYKYMAYLICPYIGIRLVRTNEIIWYKLGTFVFNNMDFTYDESSSKLNIQCYDLMCTLNGTLGGEIKDLKIKYERGANIRSVLVDTIIDAGIRDFYVCSIENTLPYDLEYSSTTYYEILSNIVNLYPKYRLYFNLDGQLIIDEIPTCAGDKNVLNNSTIQKLLISETGSASFSGIYNHIVVYGMNIETDRNITNCSYSNNIYSCIADNLVNYENFETYSIDIPSSNLANAKLNINNIGAKNIVIDDNVLIPKDTLSSGIYSFRYRKITDDFILLGKYQVKGEAWDNNPNSPFNVDNLGYELYHELSGSEYEKIYTDELANQRARYEIWKSTNIKDSLTLTLMMIPWLDVNLKISYKSKETEEENEYIIKKINSNFSNGTMTMDIIRFYPDYPEIV